jgi:hypothetical protein
VEARASSASEVGQAAQLEDGSKQNVEHVRELLGLPTELAVFQVRHGTWWIDDWGPRPADPDDAADIASAQVARAAQLVPLYGPPDVYMPSSEDEGAPVFEYV